MICYYLKGKNGEYIARDPTGRIKLVSDLGELPVFWVVWSSMWLAMYH